MREAACRRSWGDLRGQKSHALRFFLAAGFLAILDSSLPVKHPINHPAARQAECTKADRQDEMLWRRLDCDFWASRDERGRQISPYPHRYLSYGALLQRMRTLEYLYPSLVKLYNAQVPFLLCQPRRDFFLTYCERAGRFRTSSCRHVQGG